MGEMLKKTQIARQQYWTFKPLKPFQIVEIEDQHIF